MENIEWLRSPYINISAVADAIGQSPQFLHMKLRGVRKFTAEDYIKLNEVKNNLHLITSNYESLF